MTLGLAVIFENFQNFTFQHIFLPQTGQQKQTMVSNQMRGIRAV